MKCKVEVNFFKESGKWYTTEYFEFDESITWDKLYDSIREHYKTRYTGMNLVVTNFGSYRNSFPMMIPIAYR